MVVTNRLSGPAGLVLDLNHRTVAVHDAPVELGRREFDLLHLLLAERGRVVPFEEIGRRAWGHESSSRDQRFIYTTAWRLRRALEAAGTRDVIEGVRGVGYIILEEAEARLGLADLPAMLDGGSTPRAIAIFDPEDPQWLLSMVNPAAVQLSGYTVEALTSMPGAAMALWSPDERARIDEVVEEAMTSGAARIDRCHLVRADGTVVEVNLTVSRLDLHDRPPLGMAEVVPVDSGTRGQPGYLGHHQL